MGGLCPLWARPFTGRWTCLSKPRKTSCKQCAYLVSAWVPTSSFPLEFLPWLPSLMNLNLEGKQNLFFPKMLLARMFHHSGDCSIVSRPFGCFVAWTSLSAFLAQLSSFWDCRYVWLCLGHSPLLFPPPSKDFSFSQLSSSVSLFVWDDSTLLFSKQHLYGKQNTPGHFQKNPTAKWFQPVATHTHTHCLHPEARSLLSACPSLEFIL